MTRLSSPDRRIRVGRLELDLRGIAPGTGEEAARALGPALANALTHLANSRSADRDSGLGGRGAAAGRLDRIDAGRVESPRSPDADDLAARIARRIADVLEREGR
jgi:hypothetical protein